MASSRVLVRLVTAGLAVASVAACAHLPGGGGPNGPPVLELTPTTGVTLTLGQPFTFTVTNNGTGPMDGDTFSTQVGGPAGVTHAVNQQDCSIGDLAVGDSCSVTTTPGGTLASPSSGTIKVSGSNSEGSSTSNTVTFALQPA